MSQALQERYRVQPDERLPVLVILRRYADELKSRRNLSLVDYIIENIQADFSLESADLDFFEYYLETGQAILLFDGLDELASTHKEIVRNRIRSLVTTYPGNTTIVTSRIVGYDNPFRFDEDEFGHYRVAKLQLPEMERFARDWYTVRIRNKRERKANVQDLVRILRSEDHAAIRELAENPLLLTIIALVHRIDAVLPDERVILYKKCTETLLNTWHTWKFRETQVQRRGRVERRNRRRIEAIADWMHRRSGETGAAERAVVPYADLQAYLTTHIAGVEKSRDPENDPQDLADEFLEFVKQRAGLLIEVGDEQYSFVHRTFQEYLTASHIITSSEKGGVQSIWDAIGGRCGDDLWHEVIRLLVAGLRSTETQEWLIDKILTEKASGPDVNRSLLLGGLLLDNVESAELCQGEILTGLLRLGSLVQDVEQLRRITLMLRAWLAKGDESTDAVKRAFQSLWQAAGNDGQKRALALVAYTLGWSEAEVAEVAGSSVVGKGRDAVCFRLFFGEVSDLQDIDPLTPNIERLWRAQDVLLLKSSGGNIVAAATQVVTATLPHAFVRTAFEKQLVTLSAGTLSGPYIYFLAINLLLAFDDRASAREWEKVLARARALNLKSLLLDRIPDRDLALDRDRYLYRALDRARDRDRYLYRARARSRDRDRARDQGSKGGFWRTILATPESVSLILDFLCTIFELEPKAQWYEALRVVFLPQVPERIHPLFDQEEWRRVERAFAENKAGDTEIYSVAWQLLFDAWLYIFECYEQPEESLFARLAQLTSDVNAPPLRIAHCIRDLAYGDESRSDDLVAMVQSDDPSYRSIFEICLWLPTPEEAVREAREAKETEAEAKRRSDKDEI